MDLSKNTNQLLERYFDAAANLYGIIPLKKLLEIYNMQNEPIDEEIFLEFADGIDTDHKYFYIIGEDEMYDDSDPTPPIKRDIVAEYIMIGEEDCELYYKIKEEQFGKKYYIPSKEKLLKFKDEYYYEKTPSFISLRAFFRNQPNLTKEQADELAEDISGMPNPVEDDVDAVIRMTDGVNGFHFNKTNTMEFERLYLEMYNNTRLHIHCGFTPNELFGMS